MKSKLLVSFVAGLLVGTIFSYVILNHYEKVNVPSKAKTFSNIDVTNIISQKSILDQLSRKGIPKTQIPVTTDVDVSVKISSKSNDNIFDSWKLPNDWNKYVYMNASTQKQIEKHSNDLFLYVTLQGVVFLYYPPAGRNWPPIPMFGDIPPGSIVIAQHIPIKAAVNSGIIPVYHGQTYIPGIDSLPEQWKDVLK